MKTLIVVMMALIGTLAMGQATAVKTWDASNIVWQNIYPDGTKWSVLEGDKDASGRAFTYAFSIPAGYWEHHSHNQDARVAVVSGALKVAIGPKLDKDERRLIRLEAFSWCRQTYSTPWARTSTLSLSALPWALGRLITTKTCTTTNPV
jgi:hypothetical protein